LNWKGWWILERYYSIQVPADVMARIGVAPSGTRAVHMRVEKKNVVPIAKADVVIGCSD
jgi:hypothetical protein